MSSLLIIVSYYNKQHKLQSRNRRSLTRAALRIDSSLSIRFSKQENMRGPETMTLKSVSEPHISTGQRWWRVARQLIAIGSRRVKPRSVFDSPPKTRRDIKMCRRRLWRCTMVLQYLFKDGCLAITQTTARTAIWIYKNATRNSNALDKATLWTLLFTDVMVTARSRT